MEVKEPNKNKQRIIGGIILVAVVAIFLPLLFHRSHPAMNVAMSTAVPAAPEQPKVELQLPPDPHAVNSTEAPATAKTAQNSIDPDAVATISPQAAKTAAEKTAKVSQKILNTKPAPAAPAEPAVSSLAAASPSQTAPAAAPAAAAAGTDVEATTADESATADSASAATSAAPTTPATAAPAAANPAPATTTEDTPPTLPAAPAAKSKPATKTSKKTKAATSVVHGEKLILQVGSFANGDNAARLVQQLRAKGIDAHTNKKSGIVRVYIGPISTHATAVALQEKLKQQWHLNAVIKKNNL